jgi:hypothetical protein
MLVKEMIGVYSENHTKTTNIKYRVTGWGHIITTGH